MEQEWPARRSALKNLWLVARKRHEMGHERTSIPWTRYIVIEITRRQSEGSPFSVGCVLCVRRVERELSSNIPGRGEDRDFRRLRVNQKEQCCI
jgi:hypothetical protein